MLFVFFSQAAKESQAEKESLAEKDWIAMFEKAGYDIHIINQLYIASSIPLGPGMAEGGSTAATRQRIFARSLVELGYFPSVDAFYGAPTQKTLDLLSNRFFLIKQQLQTWDQVCDQCGNNMLHCTYFQYYNSDVCNIVPSFSCFGVACAGRSKGNP
jgi:hypothetical protein